jgi:hypothetical protein
VEFLPARNKLEAVLRISALTNSPPETLGPGSKEHKSVLINLANGFQIPFDEQLSKQELAAHLATQLSATWDSSCESAGQTLTLIGLNRLLESASRHVAKIQKSQKSSFLEYSLSEEIAKISKIAVDNTPLDMDGKACIEEMKAVEDSRWRQVQWQGFYFEMKVENALIQQLGGGRQKILNTEFDYVLKNIWDIKAHSSLDSKGKNADGGAILNDSTAMEIAIGNGGLGLIMLSGLPTYSLEFTKWHKSFRGGGSAEPRRVLKSRFVAEELEMYFIPSMNRLEEAVKKNQINLTKQGKNSNGKPRPDKYSLNLKVARDSDLRVFVHSFN